ncbi:Rz1-like lysis system protein LysC [Mycetohabitans sp. B2]|uniref:Rz1-like lysis system protein LysC n=1 Tax=Mycetohabitans sp. B2 TaxID=2841274 RepID=UPI001F340AB3|nr:Rz1-like lysis system protein LysC [Mycetohabitans sp. B2]MCF7694675.1 Rz1-like lysis system protein LysC [Mycetohabitans sp. B2]
MRTRLSAIGPLLPCLTMWCACTPVPPLPAPPIMWHECARVWPCTMPAMAPRTNGELAESLTAARAAWAACAAQIDMIVECQNAHRDK